MMTMMKKTIAAIVLAALAAAAGTALAQEADKNMMTYTGCIKAGEDGHYMLTNVMTGEGSSDAAKNEASPPKMLSLSSSSVAIAPHAGHKVTVMGHAMKEGSAEKLDVTSLKMVSANCS